MFKYLIVLLLSFGAFAQDNLYIVDSPDIAQDGWYWEVDKGGWGISLSIQPVSYNDSGYATQGAVYTYNEDGTPMWYTFQADYIPNDDVFAWRENRGLLGSLNGVLAQSINGGCIDCNYQSNQLSASTKGNINIDWTDPLNAVMTVNGVQKNIKLMYFHNGLNDNSAEFITQRMFFIHGATSIEPEKNEFRFYKGTAFFTPLTTDIKDNILELTTQGFYFDENLEWFVMKDHSLTTAVNYSDNPFNVFTDRGNERNDTMILMGYDELTGLAYIYPGLITYFQNKTMYSLLSCYSHYPNEPAKLAYIGLLRPAVSQTSRFYYNENDTNSTCVNPDLDINWKRQQFIDLTSITTGFNDLSNVPVLLQRPHN